VPFCAEGHLRAIFDPAGLLTKTHRLFTGPAAAEDLLFIETILYSTSVPVFISTNKKTFYNEHAIKSNKYTFENYMSRVEVLQDVSSPPKNPEKPAKRILHKAVASTLFPYRDNVVIIEMRLFMYLFKHTMYHLQPFEENVPSMATFFEAFELRSSSPSGRAGAS
jgi:hypothetical protein